MFRKLMILFMTLAALSHVVGITRTDLLYRKKLFGGENYISIYLSQQNGNPQIQPDYLAKNDYVYFTYEPKGEWYFDEKDLQGDMKDIVLLQGDSITASYLNPITADNKIIRVIAPFNKNSLRLEQPFQFCKGEFRSEVINIPEELWPGYTEYRINYLTADSLYQDEQFVSVYSTLENFLLDDKELIRSFTFYPAARSLAENAVKAYITKRNTSYDIIIFDLIQNLTEENLGRLSALGVELNNTRQLLEPYFMFITEDEQAKNKLEELISSVTDNLTSYSFALKKKTLALFETGNYFDYRFSLYIDTLCRLLALREVILHIDGIPTFDYENNFIIEQREELQLLGWENEFIQVLTLITFNIANNEYLLNDTAMKNLASQMNLEHQPYYSILLAFNCLADQDLDNFSLNLQKCFVRCTDLKLLSNLENWYQSYICTQRKIDQDILYTFNAGKAFEDAGVFEEAQKQYEIAVKLSQGFASPLFFLGRLYHRQDQELKAGIYFQKALDIQPDYIAPRIYQISSLLKNNEYQDVLDLTNRILSLSPYWVYYYFKSYSLYKLQKYSEALEIITTHCTLINEYEIEQYFLLGDIYLALGERNKALESYMKAGKLAPENDKYVEKMNSLPEQENK